jgi:hypothetical protein
MVEVVLGDIDLTDFDVEMRMEYRLGRKIEQGSEGDDIILEGRKSYEFSLKGRLSLEQLKRLEKEVSRREPVFRSEFGEFKVALKALKYRSSTGETEIELVEDVG